MSLDLFFRAETLAALRTVIRSTPFRNIIGDLRDPEGNGFIQIPGAIDWALFPSGQIVITPGDPPVTDTWTWLHLRLTGPAEASDAEGDNDEPDRWNRSRLKRWMKENGTFRTIRGVTVYEHTLGDNKRVQIWRGAQMETLDVHFHEYMGGNSY